MTDELKPAARLKFSDADEVQALKAANAELQRQLAERTEDLRILNERFTAGLANSTVTLVEQDEDLRYTWVFNPPADIDPEGMIGRRGEDYAAPEGIAQIAALRREALATGEVREAEIRLERIGRVFWYLIHSQPARLRDGRPGVITSSVDITALKQQQEHLRLITRELNHRSKNLLTIVQAVARQTAIVNPEPKAFLARLEERLGALAAAHDALAKDDWRGADLRTVIEGQLKHHLETFGGRIALSGERFALRPDTAHYMGLAVHELGTNAAKHGALSRDGGRVDVSWSAEDGVFALDWRERGGPPAPDAMGQGFGRTILELLAPKALGGEAELRFGAEGVSWMLKAPLAAGRLSAG